MISLVAVATAALYSNIYAIPKTLLNSTSVYTCPVYFTEQYINQWAQLEREIIETPSRTIVIKWHGNGGYVSMMETFVGSVYTAERQGKTIILDVDYSAISAHAVAACKIPYKYVGGDLIFHDAFYKHCNNCSKTYVGTTSDFDDCVRNGILNNNDVYKIVTLHKRITVSPSGKVVHEDWK